MNTILKTLTDANGKEYHLESGDERYHVRRVSDKFILRVYEKSTITEKGFIDAEEAFF